MDTYNQQSTGIRYTTQNQPIIPKKGFPNVSKFLMVFLVITIPILTGIGGYYLGINKIKVAPQVSLSENTVSPTIAPFPPSATSYPVLQSTIPPTPSVFPNSTIITENRCFNLQGFIDTQLDMNNFCDKDSDCKIIDIYLGCPFPCIPFVNVASDLLKIKEFHEEYKRECEDKMCIYRCPASPKQEEIKCINKKCVDSRFNK